MFYNDILDEQIVSKAVTEKTVKILNLNFKFLFNKKLKFKFKFLTVFSVTAFATICSFKISLENI